MSAAWLFAFGIFGALAIWLLCRWRGIFQGWMPDELRTARIVMVEKAVRIRSPYRIAGRPDRVYLIAGIGHIPVEYKNRDEHRVYDTDVAQLSLQAWALRQAGLSTGTFGYVVVNRRKTRERKAIKVPLKDDAFCVALIERYLALRAGKALPHKRRGAKCRSCGHRHYCH